LAAREILVDRQKALPEAIHCARCAERLERERAA
jgi:RNA polymerase-binding transcription factor DksA